MALLRSIAAVLLVVVTLHPHVAIAAERPNLVVFISDDHGYLDSSVTGSANALTPNLTRLAGDGMRLTHAFAASPTCAPSRAALLTGLMPLRNGAMLNHQPPRKNLKKLPAYLRELGYEVVAFGKVAHYGQGVEYGFDLVSHDDFHNDACVTAALEYLRRRRDAKPLCLMVGTNWPHVPWPEPAPGAEVATLSLPPTHVDTPETRDWRARYLAAVERMDSDVGLLYDAAFSQLGKNTVFMQLSDQGAQWPFAKWNLYDAGVRVSLTAVWPDVIPAGRTSGAMTSLVDVLPTLVELAGGAAPPGLDGRSFAPVLLGRQAEHRDRIFTTHSGDGRMNAYPIRSVRTPRWKFILNLQPKSEHHTHIDRGKDVDGNHYWQSWLERAKTDAHAAGLVARYHRRPLEELYDLRSDDHEQYNLADDPSHAERLAGLRAELAEWMNEQGDYGIETEEAVTAAFGD